LAETIASFPQATVCSDRAAVYEGLGKPIEDGLALEARRGRGLADVATDAAALSTAGAGRGGSSLS
jgi:enoyl-CoA hydratase